MNSIFSKEKNIKMRFSTTYNEHSNKYSFIVEHENEEALDKWRNQYLIDFHPSVYQTEISKVHKTNEGFRVTGSRYLTSD